MNLGQLQEQLKNRHFFENNVSPMQFSAIFAKLLFVMAGMLAVPFLLPLLWRFITGGLNAPGAYNTIFNAKMGGGMGFFIFILAVVCQVIAKKNRNKIYTKAYQAYLKNPVICVLTAVFRRNDVTLYAYARAPAHQKSIEQLLISAFAHNSKSYDVAYARIKSSHMKHKGMKMDSLKKVLIAQTPVLGAYEFSLNCYTQPIEEGNQRYYLYLKSGLLAAHGNYLQLEVN